MPKSVVKETTYVWNSAWRIEAGFELGKGNGIDSVIFYVGGQTQQHAWECAKELTLHYYEECELVIKRIGGETDDEDDSIIGFEFEFYAQTKEHGEVYCTALVPYDTLREAMTAFMASCHLDMTKALYVRAGE